MAESGIRAGAAVAAIGGAAALAGTLLLPFHAGSGSLGAWIAGAFLVAGLALALGSIELASRAARVRERESGLRSWATLGAAGFLVGGAGLVADVIERPIVTAEIGGVLAVAAWWVAAGRALRRGPFSHLGTFTLACAALALATLALQLAWSPPAGAVPARFAYVLWGPWGSWLAFALARRPSPVG